MITYDELYVGAWVSPATGGVLEVRSPHDRSLTGTAVVVERFAKLHAARAEEFAVWSPPRTARRCGSRAGRTYLVAHPGVDKIAFTGSTAAGRRIAAIAGEQLKRVSLELDGKSASRTPT